MGSAWMPIERVNNKSPSAVRSGRKSCRVNMTVLLSFEEKTDDARACAQSEHCPFNKGLRGKFKIRFTK